MNSISDYVIFSSDGAILTGDQTTAAVTETAKTDVTPMQTVFLGLGTVFAGLLAIVIICSLTGLICNSRTKKSAPQTFENAAEEDYITQDVASGITENHGELAAAVSAAIAEELGTDVSGIRILSMKKI